MPNIHKIDRSKIVRFLSSIIFNNYCQILIFIYNKLLFQILNLINIQIFQYNKYSLFLPMAQHQTQQSLLTKINSLKQQLASSLDKAIKVSEIEQRQKYVDSITSLKRELQQLKVKVEKDSHIEQSVKVYNKIVLKLNTLVGELNMKQNKCLWNKENKRKNRVGEYEDLLQELVERDDQIKSLKSQISHLKASINQHKEEYSELEESMKIIMEKHHASVQQHIETEKNESAERIHELEQEITENLKIISGLRGLEKENILLCSKGADQIHRLSKQLSIMERNLDKSEGMIKYKEQQIRILQLQISKEGRTHENQQIIINESMNKIKDQQFRLKVNQEQLETLKQILSKRNEEVKNMQEHYEGRIHQIKSLYERRIDQSRQQGKEKQRQLKQRIEYLQSQLEGSLSTISQLNLNILTFKQSIQEIQTVKKEFVLKQQLEDSKHRFQINRLSELCQFQQSTNRQLANQKLELQYSWKHLKSSQEGQTHYFNTQQSEIKDQQAEQIDQLSRRLLKSQIQQEKSNEDKRDLERKYQELMRQNGQLKDYNRRVDLQKRTLQISLLEIRHQLEGKINQASIFQQKISKQQNAYRFMKNKCMEMETELDFKNNKIVETNYQLSKLESKYKQLEMSYNQSTIEMRALESKYQKSSRQMKQSQADGRIQYEQQVRHLAVIKSLNTRIQELERVKREYESKINKLQDELNSNELLNRSLNEEIKFIKERQPSKFFTVPNQQQKQLIKQSQNSLNMSNVSKAKSIKIKVLEDIRKIIHIME